MITVVGLVHVEAGRLLVARSRNKKAFYLPGGKIEAGESPEDALRREVREELGCSIEVDLWLTPSVPVGAVYLLRVAVARLVDGEPEPVEHDRVRWLAAGELDAVDWLDADRPFLAELASHLR